MVERKHLEFYIRRGFRVTPVAFDEKRPLLKGWLEQRIGLEDLDRYFPEGTPLNVGLVTGEGVVDVDVDEEGARLLAPHLLPPTGMCHGRVSLGVPSHYWYRLVDGGAGLRTVRYVHPESQSCLVELRHGGVQTVVPPSRLGGDPLVWYRDGEAPLVLGEVRSAELDRRVRLLACGAMLLGFWRDGVRHDLSLSLSGALAKLGYSEEEALLFIGALSEVAGDREWRDRLESIRSTYRRVRSGARVVGVRRLRELLPDVVVDKLSEWLRVGVGRRGVSSVGQNGVQRPMVDDPGWELPRLIRFDEVQADEADEIVPNLLYAGKCAILAGAPGVGKSTFALDIADALSRPKGEGVLWGQFITGGYRVLWLDFDESFSRFKAIADRFYGKAPRELYVVPRAALHPLTAETYGYYKRLIQERGIDVLIVDTMHDWFQTEDANNAMLARDRLSLVRLLCEETGVTVLMLDHVRKGAITTDRVDVSAVSGSIRWAGKVDAVAVLRRAPAELEGEPSGVIASYARQMRAVLSVVKCRYGMLMDLPVRMESFRFVPDHEVPRSFWGEYCGPKRISASRHVQPSHQPLQQTQSQPQPQQRRLQEPEAYAMGGGETAADWDARLESFLDLLTKDDLFGLEEDEKQAGLRVFRKAGFWGYPRVRVRHPALVGEFGGPDDPSDTAFVGGDVRSWYELVARSVGTDAINDLERALDETDWETLADVPDPELRRVLALRKKEMGELTDEELLAIQRIWTLATELGFPSVEVVHMRVPHGKDAYKRAIPAFPKAQLADWIEALNRLRDTS